MKPVLKIVAAPLLLLLLGSFVSIPAQAKAVKAIKVRLATISPLQKGQAKVRKGDYKGAIADFTHALRSNPKSAEAYMGRGLSYYSTNNSKKAIADFTQVLILQPRNDRAFYKRGQARADIEDFQGSLSDINQAIRLNPRYAEAYNHRAMIYGDYKGI